MSRFRTLLRFGTTASYIYMKKILIFLSLLAVAVIERLWFDLGPNVELIMVASILASMYLGRKWGVALALIALAMTDLVIGNTMIMVFTWSAFALIAFGGKLLKNFRGNKQILASGGYGLVSALWFYFYTNFGVWLITPMYEKSWSGLIMCYTMALPFLRIHAVSSGLLIVGSLSIIKIIESLKNLGTQLKSEAVPQL